MENAIHNSIVRAARCRKVAASYKTSAMLLICTVKSSKSLGSKREQFSGILLSLCI